MNTDCTRIETIGGDKDAVIHIRRDSKDFLAAARALSDFVDALDLPANKHNRLIELTITQVGTAEKSGFTQGFELGLECGRYEASEDKSIRR